MAYTTINKGSSYFNTVIYTGDGASPKSITGVGFKPDFVWSKSRSTVENHNLYDAVRGGTQGLRSNSDAIETSSNIYGYVSTFNSDGVTYISGGTNNDLNNGSGVTFVNWNWLASNTTVSNTSGTISSTVSANPTSGFSIVSYTGNGTSGATVGHGLGVAPRMIIVKNRTRVDAWPVDCRAVSGILYLNETGALGSYGAVEPFVSTAPTSTVFSLGSAGNTNFNTSSLIAYCFAEVKGYSKFGSYTGNGSADGTFIYTGFKPAFFLCKRTDAVSSVWFMFDDVRNTFNVVNKDLYANTTDSESTTDRIDFLSNGFKCRNTSTSLNASGGTYIYMAFAENPFVSSTQIPTTAR
jgi:hypothetical protein